MTAAAQGKGRETGGYYLAFVALGLVNASLGPTLPGLAAQVGAPLNEISLLFTAGSLGYLAGSLLGGRALDRIQGHSLMGGVLLLLTLLMALVPVAPWLGLLLGVMLLRGLAAGTVDVSGNTLLVWLYGPAVGPFMSGLHFCFGVGALAAPVIVAQSLRLSGDIDWAYWILAVLILPVALWVLHLPRPTEQSRQVEDPSTDGSLWTVALIAVVLLFYVGAEISMGGWIFTYGTATGFTNEAQAAYLTSLFYGVFTAGRLLSIPLVRRYSPATMLIADWSGCLISLGALVLFGDVPGVLWLGTMGVGLSMASVFPTMISYAEQQVAITGRVMGWFFVGASLGGMTLPWLIGQVFEARGPQVTMPAILASIALATVVFGVLLASARDEQRW